MKILLEEYGIGLYYFFACLFCAFALGSVLQNAKELTFFLNAKQFYQDNKSLSHIEKPILEIEEVVVIYENDHFDYKRYINKACDFYQKFDLIDKVEIYFEKSQDFYLNTIDSSVLGERKVKYVLTYQGVKTIREQIVIVKRWW